MVPYYIWTLRLWFYDISLKRSGIWRLDIEFLSRKIFMGKRKFEFFTHQ
jgi:hypothetical protein